MSEREAKRARVNGSSAVVEETILYQGDPGCYSEKAATKYFEGRAVDVRGVSTLSEVFKAVEAGDATYGIAPMENSVSGSLHSTFDALLKSSLQIVGEIGCVEEHCLIAPKGVAKADIRRVRGIPFCPVRLGPSSPGRESDLICLRDRPPAHSRGMQPIHGRDVPNSGAST